RIDIASLQELTSKTAIIQENEIVRKLDLIIESQMRIISDNAKYKEHEMKIAKLQDDVFALKAGYKELKQG
ncbi:MAG: hypothetical protein RR315_06835, partial [Oscillospiraceae bacterium]